MSENINTEKKQEFKSRVWFCTAHKKALENIGLTIPTEDPAGLLEMLNARWSNSGVERKFSGCYAVSAKDLEHVHMVLASKSQCTLKTVQKVFPGVHADSMKGTKEDAQAYLRKEGKFEDKGEKVLAEFNIDGIESNQGRRNDLEQYGQMLENGYTPKQIFIECGIESEKYRSMIENHFYLLKEKQTPVKRDVSVYWHTGLSGSGKSYTYVKLCEEHGEDNVYFISDYKNPWDDYNGEPIVVMDDFKSNVPLTELLTWLDCYKTTLRARYANKKALYKEVHITSVYPPEAAFRKYIENGTNRVETYEQLARRITLVKYHIKIVPGVWRVYDFPNREDWVINTMQEQSQKQYQQECENYNVSRETMVDVTDDELPL